MYIHQQNGNQNSQLDRQSYFKIQPAIHWLFALLLFCANSSETSAQRLPTIQQLERLLDQNSEAYLNGDGNLTELEFKTFRKQQRRTELLGEAPPESKFDFPVEFTWATMSDGVKIALAVGFPKGYNPSDSFKWPAILRVSGYPGASIPDPPSQYGEKYVMVRASVRGTGASGGRKLTYTYVSQQPGGTVTILQDRKHPSSLLLPILHNLPPIPEKAPITSTIAGLHINTIGEL
jgi:hypothetical protein